MTSEACGSDQSVSAVRFSSLPNFQRVLALKKLQLETMLIDVEFHKRLFALDAEYLQKHQAIWEQRNRIINGQQPVDGDKCDVPPNEIEKIEKLLQKLDTDEREVLKAFGDNTTKIPNFWLDVLKNSTVNGCFVRKCDENALTYLRDIKVSSTIDDALSFKFEFHFDANPYFENVVLTKQYLLNCELDEDDLFAFEGPLLRQTIGCEIKWKENMNIFATESESFFKFFHIATQETMSADASSANQCNQPIDDLESDFEMALFFKEKLIPRAILYYLNESDESTHSNADCDEDADREHDALSLDEHIVSELQY